MVGLRRHRGRLGKLTPGPASQQAVADLFGKDRDIYAAAVAGLNGHGDFMRLLALDPADWQIAVAVINEQQRIIRQRNGGA